MSKHDSANKPKKKGKWKKVLLIILICLLLLILVTVAAVGFFMNHLLNQVTPYDPADDITISIEEAEQMEEEDPGLVPVEPEGGEDLPDIEDLTIPQEEPQPTAPAEEETNWDNVINIMLVGQDRRPGEGRQRSDSMILFTYNKSKNTITLTSFMRDQYVQIPGYKNNKMNASYAYGGMNLLNKTLETNFGVQVDGNVEVDFNSFQKVIDLLGGVDIKLTKKEADYMNTGNLWNLTKGTHRLTGEQALSYARIRYIDSDYRRAERQRTVISSLIQRYKSLPVGDMLALLDDILPLVKTNMSKSQIMGYAMELAPALGGADLDTLRIPVDGTFRQGSVRVRPGLAAWFQYDIDFAANRKTLRKLFEP